MSRWRYPKRDPLRIPADRIAKIHDHYDYDPSAHVSNSTYVRALFTLRQREEVRKARMRGFEGPRFVCYFWWQGWRHFNLGFHFHCGDPLNVEIHVPFGFVRVGLAGRTTREVLYENILCREIIRRYEDWTNLELALESAMHGTPRLPMLHERNA